MPERTEYRVIRADGMLSIAYESSLADMGGAPRIASEDTQAWRIQKRTVVETPWEYLGPGEQGRS